MNSLDIFIIIIIIVVITIVIIIVIIIIVDINIVVIIIIVVTIILFFLRGKSEKNPIASNQESNVRLSDYWFECVLRWWLGETRLAKDQMFRTKNRMCEFPITSSSVFCDGDSEKLGKSPSAPSKESSLRSSEH